MGKSIRGLAPLAESEPYLKVIQWFFAYPNKEITLGDLSEKLRISKSTANREVSKLSEKDFLKKEVFGKTWRISCNQNHAIFKEVKIGYNLAMISSSGILDEVHRIVPHSRASILFGSYRKGDDVETSDIDIAVEVTDDEEMKIVPLGIVPQLGYRKNVPVNLHIFSRKKIDKNLFANIANGIVLEGFLEVRP